jgi:hypothetical protein
MIRGSRVVPQGISNALGDSWELSGLLDSDSV